MKNMIDKALSAACRYVDKGWCVIPVPYKEKGPKQKGWQNRRFQPDDLEKYFSGSKNIGIILGEPSGGLVDVDLDCDEARHAAYYYMPETKLCHGRRSNPASHLWYVVKDSLSDKTIQFHDVANSGRNQRATLVELRSTGCQTIVPPSVHPSGEEILWESEGEPTEIDRKMLLRCVRLTASVAIVARHWPDEGVCVTNAALLFPALCCDVVFHRRKLRNS